MVLLDSALREREQQGRPIRVALVGAGMMGANITYQVTNHVPGMEVVAIANRTPERAEAAFRRAGREDVARVDGGAALQQAIEAGRPAVTEDPMILGEAGGVDIVVEATGSIDHAAQVCLAAIGNGKHVLTSNPELAGTLGPILKVRADEAGVVFSDADGDQPGTQMNLFRQVKGFGLRPVLVGNVKFLQDPYRTPETQKAFAEAKGISPIMATQFADGTKISFEMVTISNATGLPVGRRGAYGPKWEGHLQDAVDLFPMEQMLETGLSDYLLGAHPSPGVFVYAVQDDEVLKPALDYYKMGPGPIYTFYAPTHLAFFELPNSIARAVLFNDETVSPLGAPVVEVVTLAKRDLRAGETLDGIGHYTVYGTTENAPVAREQDLLPMGLAEGCVLKRDVPRDGAITFADVELPAGRAADRLWEEQVARFATADVSA
jgi:predicted homoserine dehydrogenase-like protein